MWGSLLQLGYGLYENSQNESAAAQSIIDDETARANALAANQLLYGQSQNYNAPYTTGGAAGVNKYMGYDMSTGLTEGEQYTLDQNIAAARALQASQGLLNSGKAAKDISSLASEAASNAYTDRIQALYNQANLGSQAAQGAASAGTSAGQNISSIYAGGGVTPYTGTSLTSAGVSAIADYLNTPSNKKTIDYSYNDAWAAANS